MSQGDPASRTVDSDATSEQSLDDIDRRPDDTPVDAPTVRTTTRQKVAAAAAARLEANLATVQTELARETIARQAAEARERVLQARFDELQKRILPLADAK